MKRSIVLLMLILPCFAWAQAPEKYACKKEDRSQVADHFRNIEANDLLISDFRRASRVHGKSFPLCFHSCVVSLPLPVFPEVARQYRLTGTVRVETLADEGGRIIYAKAVSGPVVFRRRAEEAACRSSFRRFNFSGSPIKFRWNIIYNFMK